MAGFDPTQYETVADRLARAHADHPDLRVITDLVHVQRTEDGKPLQYIARAQIFIGEVLKAQDFAEEIVGNGPVNRYSALENCTTSAIGRALADMGYQGKRADGSAQRPTVEEMEKVQRAQAVESRPLPKTSKPLLRVATVEESAFLLPMIEMVRNSQTVDELRKIHSDNKNLLEVKVGKTTLLDEINKRVAYLK